MILMECELILKLGEKKEGLRGSEGLFLNYMVDWTIIQFNDMKKNASCKVIKNNFTQVSSFRPLAKRPLNLDLLSNKAHSPKIQFPSTAKAPPEYALRKKIFSSSKNLLLNNENVSEANIVRVHSGTPLVSSNKGYDQLKNKIINLQGRLVEIKKNFETSFQKRNDKSKLGKQNAQFLRDKQKSKLVLTKYDDKLQKGKHEKVEKGRNLAKQAYEKEHSIRRTTLQLKSDKNDSNTLQDYVTTFTCQSPAVLTHCSSDANLFKHHKFQKGPKTTQRYYIDTVLSAFTTQNPTSFEQICRTHLTASFDILQYIKGVNKPMPQKVNMKPLTPTSKPTLIFDLDQTLIHCNENSNISCDVLLPIKFPNGSMVKAGINIRPYARQCLEELAKDFELIVFTASHECYANVIVDYLDQKRLISHRFFRDSCWKSEEGFYVKDLRVIDRNLKDVLLIDNAAYSYSLQLENGVPIIPFYDNKADLELKSLVGYLKNLGGKNSLKQLNSKVMRLAEYSQAREPKQLLTRLYGWEN